MAGEGLRVWRVEVLGRGLQCCPAPAESITSGSGVSIWG